MLAPATPPVNDTRLHVLESTRAAFVVHRNGQLTSAEGLANLAFAGQAHFTAMPIRNHQVRGFDLHLARLRSASMELFGRALPDNQVRSYLRAALDAGPADLSLTATVYSPEGEFTLTWPGVAPEMLVRTAPPSSGPQGSLTLATVEHERYLPQFKHVGEVAKPISCAAPPRRGSTMPPFSTGTAGSAKHLPGIWPFGTDPLWSGP